jgi:flagellar biosynthesis component FlhA
MRYDKGTVIEKRGIVFKDTATPDPRGRHPAMIAIAVSDDNQYMYFLTLTSQVEKYFEYPANREKYMIIKKSQYNMLKKTSLVNLQNIYKDVVADDNPVAFIQPKELRELIKKFKNYQNCHPDEYYDEIRDLL